MFRAVLTAVLLSAVALPAGALTLKASHQWPSGDVRDEMLQIIKREVEAANVGLEIKIYPAKSLFKPKEQWGAMVKGQLDISAFPLDYASGRHPQFSATLMPGLVRNHERAARLNDSPFMEEIKKIIDEAGVVVLSDAWLAGAFASTKQCIRGPETVKGLVMRAAGPMFEEMLAAAGASIASMPSSEIYTAVKQGVLDAANTSSASFVSYRLYEVMKCLTAPGRNALWFMYEPVLMSKRTWDKLNDAQREALRAAGEKAEAYFFDKARELDDNMVKVFREAGVEVVEMTDEEFDAWLEVAKTSAYKTFSEKVEGGAKLIELALSVE